MMYNIWNIQAIAGQYQNQPSAQQQPDTTEHSFLSTLSRMMAQTSAATTAGAPAVALPASFIFPHMREVQHVDLGSLASKKKVHQYIA